MEPNVHAWRQLIDLTLHSLETKTPEGAIERGIQRMDDIQQAFRRMRRTAAPSEYENAAFVVAGLALQLRKNLVERRSAHG